jgi:hypothetical protein
MRLWFWRYFGENNFDIFAVSVSSDACHKQIEGMSGLRFRVIIGKIEIGILLFSWGEYSQCLLHRKRKLASAVSPGIITGRLLKLCFIETLENYLDAFCTILLVDNLVMQFMDELC